MLLTVVMPAYNEHANIESAVDEVRRLVLDRVPRSTLVVVDDGSRDETGAILDRVAETDPRVVAIHQANAGHGRALRRGLAVAEGEYVFLVDSDRQIPLDGFASAWQLAQGRDAVLGVRAMRDDPLLRLAIMHAVRVTIRFIFGVRLRDANAPFKIVKQSVWHEASAVIAADAAIPSIALAIYVKRRSLDVVECEVVHRRRAAGSAGMSTTKLLALSARAFFELLAFRRRLHS